MSKSLRDENEELMNQYLTNGNKVIPKVIALDEDGQEVAVWTKSTDDRFNSKDLTKNLPEKGTTEYEERFEG